MRVAKLVRRKQPIEHDVWPARSGLARVLIENPDAAEIWAHADALREAGYDVASCFGPDDRRVCPLVSEGRCPLVEEADIVISTTRMGDDGRVVAALRRVHPNGLIVEGTHALDLPVSEARLLAAVTAARGTTVDTPEPT